MPVEFDNIGEQKSSAVVFRHAADELAAHQRMKLRVLVDLLVDFDQKTTLLEIDEMGLKVETKRPLGMRVHAEILSFWL